jgi:hypothetical protein
LPFPTRRRAVVAVAAVAALFCAAAPAAQASHLTGGTLTASIDGAGVLRGEALWYEAGTCQVGDQVDKSATVIAPSSGGTQGVTIPFTAFRCTGSSEYYRSTFTQDLADAGLFGPSLPTGRYRVVVSDCCRIGGILNVGTDTSVTLEATPRYVPGSSSSTPNLMRSVPLGFGIGRGYTANFAPLDPDGGSVLLSLLQSSDDLAPLYDDTAPGNQRVTLGGDQIVRISAGDTGGYTNGQRIIYKVRGEDTDGDSTVHDVLLKATSNIPPVLASGDSTISVPAGERFTVPVAATDADNGAVVTLDGEGLPAWATLSATAGNPATGEIVLAPPAGLTGSYTFAVLAYDDDSALSLEDRREYTVRVVPPPAATLPATPAPEAPKQFRLVAVERTDGTGGASGGSMPTTLWLDVPGPGRIDTEAIAVELPRMQARSAAKRSLKLFARSTKVERAGRLGVDIRLTRKSLRLLAKHGLMKVNVRATYVPSEGEPVRISQTLTFKRFTLLCLCRPRLSKDLRTLRVVSRVPYGARLRAVARVRIGGRRVTLGSSKTRVVRRGERESVLYLDARKVRRALDAGVKTITVTGVLRRKGTSQITRTRVLSLTDLAR